MLHMTAITITGGKVVLRDGKVGTGEACCCDPCVPCTCNKCVTYSFVEVGDLVNFPEQEPYTGTYAAHPRPNSCIEKEPCFNLEYAEPGFAQLGEGCSTPGTIPAGQWVATCIKDDFPNFNYVLFESRGGAPCGRIRCDSAGAYFLDICVFNRCVGTDFEGAGRLTRKSYAITLGEDGCPASVGEEVSSSVTDWVKDDLLDEWVPASAFGIDLDGQTSSGVNWCNQDCWDQWPFDYQVCDVVNGMCDCNAFP